MGMTGKQISPISQRAPKVETCATEILTAKCLATLHKLRLRHMRVLRVEMGVHCFTHVFQVFQLTFGKRTPKCCAIKGWVFVKF